MICCKNYPRHLEIFSNNKYKYEITVQQRRDAARYLFIIDNHHLFTVDLKDKLSAIAVGDNSYFRGYGVTISKFLKMINSMCQYVSAESDAA